MAGPAFQPANPDFRQRCLDSFARQPFMTHLGGRMVEVAPGYCVAEIPVRPELTQQHGFVHGGVLASLADANAGYAAFSLMPADSAPLTVEYKLNIVRPGGGKLVRGKATVVKPGRTLNVVQSDVYNVDEEGTEILCVTSLQTVMTMQGWDDAVR